MRCVTLSEFNFPACGRCSKQRSCHARYYCEVYPAKRKAWDEAVAHDRANPKRHAKQLQR